MYIVYKPVNESRSLPELRVKLLEKLVGFGNFNASSTEDSYSDELTGES